MPTAGPPSRHLADNPVMSISKMDYAFCRIREEGRAKPLGSGCVVKTRQLSKWFGPGSEIFLLTTTDVLPIAILESWLIKKDKPGNQEKYKLVVDFGSTKSTKKSKKRESTVPLWDFFHHETGHETIWIDGTAKVISERFMFIDLKKKCKFSRVAGIKTSLCEQPLELNDFQFALDIQNTELICHVLHEARCSEGQETRPFAPRPYTVIPLMSTEDSHPHTQLCTCTLRSDDGQDFSNLHDFKRNEEPIGGVVTNSKYGHVMGFLCFTYTMCSNRSFMGFLPWGDIHVTSTVTSDAGMKKKESTENTWVPVQEAGQSLAPNLLPGSMVSGLKPSSEETYLASPLPSSSPVAKDDALIGGKMKEKAVAVEPAHGEDKGEVERGVGCGPNQRLLTVGLPNAKGLISDAVSTVEQHKEVVHGVEGNGEVPSDESPGVLSTGEPGDCEMSCQDQADDEPGNGEVPSDESPGVLSTGEPGDGEMSSQDQADDEPGNGEVPSDESPGVLSTGEPGDGEMSSQDQADDEPEIRVKLSENEETLQVERLQYDPQMHEPSGTQLSQQPVSGGIDLESYGTPNPPPRSGGETAPNITIPQHRKARLNEDLRQLWDISQDSDNNNCANKLCFLLDKQHSYGKIKGYVDLAKGIGIPEVDYEAFAYTSQHSPSEKLFEYLTGINPKLAVAELKKALHEINNKGAIRILEDSRFSDGTLIVDLLDEKFDVIAKLSVALDYGQNNWEKLSAYFKLKPSCYSKFSRSSSYRSPTTELLQVLHTRKPNLTVKQLKDKLGNVAGKQKLVEYLNGIPELERVTLNHLANRVEVMDELQYELDCEHWKNLAKEFKLGDETIEMMVPNQNKENSPAENLFYYQNKCMREGLVLVNDFVLVLAKINRYDCLDLVAYYIVDGPHEINCLLKQAGLPVLEM